MSTHTSQPRRTCVIRLCIPRATSTTHPWIHGRRHHQLLTHTRTRAQRKLQAHTHTHRLPPAYPWWRVLCWQCDSVSGAGWLSQFEDRNFQFEKRLGWAGVACLPDAHGAKNPSSWRSTKASSCSPARTTVLAGLLPDVLISPPCRPAYPSLSLARGDVVQPQVVAVGQASLPDRLLCSPPGGPCVRAGVPA